MIGSGLVGVAYVKLNVISVFDLTVTTPLFVEVVLTGVRKKTALVSILESIISAHPVIRRNATDFRKIWPCLLRGTPLYGHLLYGALENLAVSIAARQIRT